MLNLIRAHALLHQCQRERDVDGRIIASIDDYAVVRELVADVIAEVVDATVPYTVRDTVNVVRDLVGTTGRTVTTAEVGRALKLDKSAAYRRVQVALSRGYLRNLEDREKRPARLVIGEPLPDDVVILPMPDQLSGRLQGCTGTTETSSPSSPPLFNACEACGKPLTTRAAREIGRCPPHMTEDQYQQWLQFIKHNRHAA